MVTNTSQETAAFVMAAAFYVLLPALSAVMLYKAIKVRESLAPYWISLATLVVALVVLLPANSWTESLPNGHWLITGSLDTYWAYASPALALLAIVVSLFIVLPKILRTRPTQARAQRRTKSRV